MPTKTPTPTSPKSSEFPDEIHSHRATVGPEPPPLVESENRAVPSPGGGFWSGWYGFLRHRFSLSRNQAPQQDVIRSICRGVEFKGANLWILIFAIVVASVGLNMNSTAVVIGAMLISPLMGPIMGVGLSLGISDFGLLGKSLRNFLFASLVSLIVSMLYFMLSPLTVVQSELLLRTTPTLWDVLIAVFGGLAGIVAQTRADSTTTVLPGVAIATALMPPLCTAGFGLAVGDWRFFGGAFYLYFINAVFIALSAYVVVRVLRYSRVEYVRRRRAVLISRLIVLVVVLTVLPSIFMAYGVVRRTVFGVNAERFVAAEFDFRGSWVLRTDLHYDAAGGRGTIEVMVGGVPIVEDSLARVRGRLGHYSLGGVDLVVRQVDSLAFGP